MSIIKGFANLEKLTFWQKMGDGMGDKTGSKYP